MREIIIDENYFATPKTMVIGNSGEVASRKIKVIQPEVEGASCYIARFSVGNGSVFETEITDGVFTVPAVVLYEVGEGCMQWVARDTAGQLIAKSDLISYSVLRSLSDETTPVPVVEDTESAVSQIKEAYETAVHGLEQLNGYGTIAEVVQARRSAISNEICNSLTERIDYDITQLQSAIESGTIIDDLEISGGIINSNSGNSIYDADGNRTGLLALGGGNTASGQHSVAMGGGNTASGNTSLAFGGGCSATGYYSLALGGGNTASGQHSVAMGGGNTVSGQYSLAMGQGNTANVDNQTVIGRYNTPNSTEEGSVQHAFIIGNGNGVSNRSNAMTVDWNGNLNVSGNVTATMTDGSTISLIDIYSKIGLIEEQLASLVTPEGTA